MHKCAYCAVKISRGAVKSKPIEEIKAEFIQGLEKGYKEFSFIGTDLGSYGKDLQKDLLTLLKELVSLDGKFKIRLRNVHPQLIINNRAEFVDVTSTGKITHITSAIQHGNDRILGLMNRPYKIKDCKSAFNAIINSCPDLKIRSQLMVGFPGETETEFIDTLRLIDEINLAFVEVYPFSPRVGTLAAKMPNQVSQRTINRRQYLTIKKSLEVYKQREKVGPAVN